MDEKKQPGIKIKAIILAESDFKRNPVIPKDIKLKTEFDIAHGLDEKKNEVVVEVTSIINNEESAIFLRIKYVGVFSVDQDPNMSLEQFALNNAPAILFPYIREEINSRFLKANLFNIIPFPPINLKALNGKESQTSGRIKKKTSKKKSKI